MYKRQDELLRLREMVAGISAMRKKYDKKMTALRAQVRQSTLLLLHCCFVEFAF